MQTPALAAPALALALASAWAVAALLPAGPALGQVSEAALAPPGQPPLGPAPALRFVFDPAAATAGAVSVAADTPYSVQRGHGFEADHGIGEETDAPQAAPRPRFFSVSLPEGSYRITATLGGTPEASHTTLKAELRRLVLQGAQTAPHETLQVRFTVQVRNPQIAAGPGRAAGVLALRTPRDSTDQARNWDHKLTLEISGQRPALQALLIEPVQVPLVFLLGDSTVADQPRAPYASWGQMLPRWFGPGAAVVNLAQNGETFRDSLLRRRLDKVLALARPGDTVLMQYGHNDQKQLRDGSGSLHSYQLEIRQHLAALKAAQLQAVLVTPVERRFFEADGSLRHTLAEQVAAMRAVATEEQVPLLDLNTLSRTLYEAYGPALAPALFATGADGRVDPTHHNHLGAWLLAGLVARGLHDLALPVARELRADAPVLTAAQPPALADGPAAARRAGSP